MLKNRLHHYDLPKTWKYTMNKDAIMVFKIGALKSSVRKSKIELNEKRKWNTNIIRISCFRFNCAPLFFIQLTIYSTLPHREKRSGQMLRTILTLMN